MKQPIDGMKLASVHADGTRVSDVPDGITIVVITTMR